MRESRPNSFPHDGKDGMPLRLNWLLVFCFFICSVAEMRGQSSFVEQVIGQSNTAGGANCENYSTSKLAISCTGSWGVDSAQGYEVAVAKNNFGTMRGYGQSSVTIVEQDADGEDIAQVDEIVEDNLTILGLNGEPTASLKFEFECLQCVLYEYPGAYYDAYAGNYGPCQIYGPANSPRCTLTVPIVYNGNGQPDPVPLERQLQVNAETNVTNGAAGATVTTTVCVGYPAGGCNGNGATVKASVVNADGKVIKGVTVVGSSGHIYN
jgi:hypothetical protein